jgi:hypothetical protein
MRALAVNHAVENITAIGLVSFAMIGDKATPLYYFSIGSLLATRIFFCYTSVMLLAASVLLLFFSCSAKSSAFVRLRRRRVFWLCMCDHMRAPAAHDIPFFLSTSFNLDFGDTNGIGCEKAGSSIHTYMLVY